jgi:hypothetical protein
MAKPCKTTSILKGVALACYGLGAGFASQAHADIDSRLEHAASAFFRVYIAARPAGIPNGVIRAKFSPVISHTLAQLLERADAAERHYAKVTGRLVPPLIQGDVFTSLFEGAEKFTVRDCKRTAVATFCDIELRYGTGNSRALWVDKIFLVRNGGRWVVDDIEYGGDWGFMHKGRLKDLLRRVILDGNHARP